MKFFLTLSSLFYVFDIAKCANIIAMIPTPFYTHQASFRPLWRELAEQGHKITLITTNPMENNENITQIDISATYDIFEKHQVNKLLSESFDAFEFYSRIVSLFDDFYHYQLTQPDLVKLMESKVKFDLLFVEMLLPVHQFLSVKFDCPYIGLSTMDAPPFVHAALGNAMHPGLYPYADLGFDEKLTFTDRLISTMSTVFQFLIRPIMVPKINGYATKYLGIEASHYPNIFSQASLFLVNANPIFYSPRTITPTTINLEGGLHITEPKELPKDIQDYLDRSKDGCIYFSFGTTVNSTFVPEESIKTFLQTFNTLSPLRILWKFDKTDLLNIPENVEIRKWLPQQDVLRHPNIKLFITQGGLQSMEEAIDSAVPMLGMPFYGDQKNNVRKMVTKKFGLQLDAKNLNEESLRSTILELLENPIYKKNIEKLSAISKDHPMRGLEKAVWWTEYVLRHGNTEHLRSPSADIPLYQYFFLDILAFLLVVLLLMSLIFYSLFKCIRFVARKILNRKNKVKTS